ncbi:MAG: hypothetical protein M1835_002083 [Candelina submexicana]|nr:MAG: hypothetical protein M1835_002083 [Candelina submexicana]
MASPRTTSVLSAIKAYHVHLPDENKPRKVYLRIHERSFPKTPLVVMKVAGGWRNFEEYLKSSALEKQRLADEEAARLRAEDARRTEEARKAFQAKLDAIVPFEKFYEFAPELRARIISLAMNLDSLAVVPAGPYKYRTDPWTYTPQYYFPRSEGPMTMALLRANKRLGDEAAHLLYSRTCSFWFSLPSSLNRFLEIRPESLNLVKRIQLFFDHAVYLRCFNAAVGNHDTYVSNVAENLRGLTLNELTIIFPHPCRMDHSDWIEKCHFKVCKFIVKAVKAEMTGHVKNIKFEGGLFTEEMQAEIDTVIESPESFSYEALAGIEQGGNGAKAQICPPSCDCSFPCYRMR